MSTTHQILESLKLMECPLNIAYEGHILNGKFTFEELTKIYMAIEKKPLLPDKLNGYILNIEGYVIKGRMENNTFTLESFHHYPDEPHKLIIMRIPDRIPLEDFISPSSIWTRNNGKFLFQVIPEPIRI